MVESSSIFSCGFSLSGNGKEEMESLTFSYKCGRSYAKSKITYIICITCGYLPHANRNAFGDEHIAITLNTLLTHALFTHFQYDLLKPKLFFVDKASLV